MVNVSCQSTLKIVVDFAVAGEYNARYVDQLTPP